ncbi:MAG: transcription antitermination factor NusB [Rhodothalassiaceae bacterium]
MTQARKERNGAMPRSAARLGAVQALYQLDLDPDADADSVVAEFEAHRLGREIEGALYARADRALFADIVRGVAARGAEIDRLLSSVLAEGWPLERLESVLRAILRAGTYELLARPDIPTAVIINEYVDIAHAFFDDAEPGFANGVLDRLAKEIRA